MERVFLLKDFLTLNLKMNLLSGLNTQTDQSKDMDAMIMLRCALKAEIVVYS